MTTQIIKKLWLEFAVTGTLIACSAHTLAEPAARPSPLDRGAGSTRSASVSLADLDLSTPEGERAALERLRSTARHLCLRLGDSRDRSAHSNYVACVDQALAGARQQLDKLALASRTKEKLACSQSSCR